MRARGTMAARVGAWRRVLVYAVLALVAFAPMAKAVCDFEQLLPHGHFRGDAHALGLGKGHVHASAHGEVHPPASAVANDGSDGMDDCCDRMATAVVAEVRVVHIDSLTSHATGFVVMAVGAPPLRVPNVLPGSHRTPPPEPVFRRLPKLLI